MRLGDLVVTTPFLDNLCRPLFDAARRASVELFVGRPSSRRDPRSIERTHSQTLDRQGDRAAARSHAQARSAEHGERG